MEQYSPETLITGSDSVATTEGTLAAGQMLARLAPLGQNSTTGEFHLWAPAATNGTEVATRIAPIKADTTVGAVKQQLYKSGTFNPDLIAWPDGTTEVQKLTAFVGTPISLQRPA